MTNGWTAELLSHIEHAKLALLAMNAGVRGIPRQRYLEAVVIAVLVTLANVLITVPVLREEIAGMRREREIIIKNRDAQVAEIKETAKGQREEGEKFEQQVLHRLTSIELSLAALKGHRP